jgi:predicted O-methyltransferase YrrM
MFTKYLAKDSEKEFSKGMCMTSIRDEMLNPEKIRQLANGFQVSRIILTALELNIFSILDKKMLHAEEVATLAMVNERATERLMNALVSIGFLKKTHDKFYNSEATAQFLVKGKPEFMGGLFHSNELWRSWSTLTNAIEKGTAVYKRDDSGSDWTDSFIAAMHYRATKEAKILPMMLQLNNVKKMLDVGGGSGAFSMAFLEKNPEMYATVLDLPSVIPITKKYVEAFHYKERINYIEGNYLNDNFDCGYDMIFLSAIVHIQGMEENELLIKKCFNALNPGGQIIIKDWVMSEDKTEPDGGAIFSINMLVGTDSGDTFTEKEIKSWLASTGIQKTERKDSSFGWSLIIGYKD